MHTDVKNIKFTIKYKTDVASVNKFIEFLINFLVDNNDLAGEFINDTRTSAGVRND